MVVHVNSQLSVSVGSVLNSDDVKASRREGAAQSTKIVMWASLALMMENFHMQLGVRY